MVSPSQTSMFSSSVKTTITPSTVPPFAMDVPMIEERLIPSNCSLSDVVEKYGCIRTDTIEFQDKINSIVDPRFYCEGVSISVIGILGLFGNLLALIVLSKPNLRDVFHQLLFAVASFDLMYIMVGGFNYTFKAFQANSDVYVYLYPHIIHPFTHIAATGVIYMTVAITIERYLGLCHPFLPPTSRKAWFYVLPVVILSITMNIPKFLEIEHNWENHTNIETNETFEEISYRMTIFRMEENYIIGYKMWTRLFSDGIIPVVILLYLNTRIILALISATKVQRFNSARRQRKEINLTIILLCIVLIFFCCHSSRIILDVFEFLNVEKVLACRNLARCARRPYMYLPNNFFFFLPVISHMMMILNSSTNFIVYCLVGHNFRRELCRTIGNRRYTSVPNTLRSLVLTYDHSTIANQGFGASHKGSPRGEHNEIKSKIIEAKNRKSPTSTTSPINPCDKDESTNKSVFLKNGGITKCSSGMNGCNGHDNSLINHHAQALHPNETKNSFPMTTTSTSIIN